MVKISKLFSDNFPTITSDKELEELCNKFPDFDASYICQGSGSSRVGVRNWMEDLWKLYHPYADKHFTQEFKRNFGQRSWELYLGSTFLKRGYALEKVKQGPDFKIVKDGKHAHVEAVAPRAGSGPDKVPDMMHGQVVSVPEDQMILRLTTALSDKKVTYEEYLKKGILKDTDPFVIAINRSSVMHPDTLMPLVIKCLFGVGDLVLKIPINPIRGGPIKSAKSESSWSGKPFLKKRTGSDVSMLFFENPANAGVSAVMYSVDSIINSPQEPGLMGENIVTIHNPNAKNPIPKNFIVFGEERMAKEDFLYVTRKAQKWSRY